MKLLTVKQFFIGTLRFVSAGESYKNPQGHTEIDHYSNDSAILAIRTYALYGRARYMLLILIVMFMGDVAASVVRDLYVMLFKCMHILIVEQFR